MTRGRERNLLWLVLDGKGFALNGPSKTAAPSLPWPRETDDATWKRTGSTNTLATDAIVLVWGSRPGAHLDLVRWASELDRLLVESESKKLQD